MEKFFVFYIPAALPGILPDKYLVHVFLLIKVMRILLGNQISHDQIILSDKLLHKFCRLFEDYYGKSSLITIIMCVHLHMTGF